VALVDVEAPLMERALTSYGPLRAAESAFVHRVALEREPAGFSPGLRAQLLEGRALPAQAYLAAQALRAELSAQLDAALRGLDAWLLPTAPLPAPLLGSERVALERGETEHRTAFVRLTLPFSLVGLPALSLPFAEVEGLPLGVQLVGARDADARVLEVGRWLEAQLASVR
jgi:aspartyl-tRNA(Asn)/glutamyl-tRNA(Gln) amidotransferase subunit A